MKCKKCKIGEKNIFFARREKSGEPTNKAEYYCNNPNCEDFRDVKEIITKV